MFFSRVRALLKTSSGLISGVAGFLLMAGVIALAVYFGRNHRSPVLTDESSREIRVLSYSSFLSSWGPGPELAKMFESLHGVKVIFVQTDDAGLLLAKMDVFPTDVVLGFDQLSLPLARRTKTWLDHDVQVARFQNEKFLAFDWSPMGFIYREGEIDPPKDLQDLLSPRFEEAIALQDPRSSTPGFQFLNWLATDLGEDGAFEFLKRLKPNVHSMSGSWSQAYGLFTRGLAKLTFSYETSVLYHRLSEKDERYKFATFPGKAPVQIEFAAIPDSCSDCEAAKIFLKFLVSPGAQSIIMNRNWMLPVSSLAAEGTPFAGMIKAFDAKMGSDVSTKKMDSIDASKPSKLLQRWSEVGL